MPYNCRLQWHLGFLPSDDCKNTGYAAHTDACPAFLLLSADVGYTPYCSDGMPDTGILLQSASDPAHILH